MRRRDICATSSRSSDLGAPSFLMASMRAATSSTEARVSARRSWGERGFGAVVALGGRAGASTSMASAAAAVAIDTAGEERDGA